MIKKTYRTFSLRGLDLHLNGKDGKKYEIIFRGGIQVDSTARFSTTDKEIQDAIEGISGFGRDYYLESKKAVGEEAAPSSPVIETADTKEEEPNKPVVDMKDVKRFHNLPEMKNAMIELGLPVTPEMNNYLQLKSIAAKAGYDFQISKAS